MEEIDKEILKLENNLDNNTAIINELVNKISKFDFFDVKPKPSPKCFITKTHCKCFGSLLLFV